MVRWRMARVRLARKRVPTRKPPPHSHARQTEPRRSLTISWISRGRHLLFPRPRRRRPKRRRKSRQQRRRLHWYRRGCFPRRRPHPNRRDGTRPPNLRPVLPLQSRFSQKCPRRNRRRLACLLLLRQMRISVRWCRAGRRTHKPSVRPLPSRGSRMPEHRCNGGRSWTALPPLRPLPSLRHRHQHQPAPSALHQPPKRRQ